MAIVRICSTCKKDSGSWSSDKCKRHITNSPEYIEQKRLERERRDQALTASEKHRFLQEERMLRELVKWNNEGKINFINLENGYVVNNRYYHNLKDAHEVHNRKVLLLELLEEYHLEHSFLSSVFNYYKHNGFITPRQFIGVEKYFRMRGKI